ncbi:ATP-binding cassette domain-containing protein [Klebsiella quasipneumoniae subsp. quasipneumoniae]|nr:ATP-binding cassette domain-containing protein [Klebsiella quasipneumoniae]MDV1507525.1 ATP-binding cassette domain-containing protein [Klebsiella quasipneumoniae subsp. quasipneumoniae]MDV1522602.1 ATP-binding cassette domain-containing protein [Klebsiella quasipneumoniae subsp. quasipneumoniae]MDV1559573.1 ATP-binding cassette domain-containing protein [Klebsiella quasipneumoniae subsp. quasipneumoniae]MDV1582229.1 ATP-binding cassette domain-containing protein [Klebsiella quasipneumoniae 
MSQFAGAAHLGPHSGERTGYYTAEQGGAAGLSPAYRDDFPALQSAACPHRRRQHAVPLEIAGVPRAAREARVRELLELVDLSDKAAAFPSQLSGGQKQRVGIARALAARPEVLLCDEATSALDPETTASVLALLADINQRLNLTIVLITHQLEVVKTICDHAALLEQGEIVESGKLADLLVTPWSRLRQSLLHDPQAEQDFLTRHGVQGRPLCGVA